MCAIAAVLAIISISAQELNCKVEINSDKVANVSKDVFNTLQEAMNDYMNSTRWGNAQFMANERIECRLFFTISEYENDIMKGDLQIQSSRPVYNSSYTTTLINFKDTKIEFEYVENQPLVFSETTMESNLTAILNFYAYFILAMDFDSFRLNGGDYYWDRMNNVVMMAQSTGE